MPVEQFRWIGPWTIEAPDDNDFELVRTAVERGVCKYVVFNRQAVGETSDGDIVCRIEGFASACMMKSMAAWRGMLGPRLTLSLNPIGAEQLIARITNWRAIVAKGATGWVEEYGTYDLSNLNKPVSKIEDVPPPVLSWQQQLFTICLEDTDADRVHVHVVVDGASYKTTRTDFMLDVHQGQFRIPKGSSLGAQTVHGCLIPPACQTKDDVFNYMIATPDVYDVYLFSNPQHTLTSKTPLYAMIDEIATGIVYTNRPPLQFKVFRGRKVIILTGLVDDNLNPTWNVWKVDDGKLVPYIKWKQEEDERKANKKRDREEQGCPDGY